MAVFAAKHSVVLFVLLYRFTSANMLGDVNVYKDLVVHQIPPYLLFHHKFGLFSPDPMNIFFPAHFLQVFNHLEERLLDQAQARASYTPLFWAHSRSISQGMILDVQPLVKSLFCPIRPSPNGFFDSEASIP